MLIRINKENSYLSRDWGGSEADIMDIGLRAMETHAFSSEIPNYYFKALGQVTDMKKIGSREGHANVTESETWKNICFVLDGYLAEPVYAHLRTWNLQRYAGYAYLFRQREVFTHIIDQLGGVDNLDVSIFNKIGKNKLNEALQWYTSHNK